MEFLVRWGFLVVLAVLGVVGAVFGKEAVMAALAVGAAWFVRWASDSIVTLRAEVQRLREREGLRPLSDKEFEEISARAD